MGFDRNELIRELGKNFNVGETSKDKNRFHENTQTLMSEKDAQRLEEIEAAQSKVNRHELVLQLNDYSEVLLGRRSFIVTRDIGYMSGDSLVLREYDNLNATGNMMVKILTLVDKISEGIEAGYCVLTWV